MANHNWTEKDDIIVLYITKYGYENISYSKNDIAKLIDISEGSLSYRIGNFKAIQGIGNATNYAKLSKIVFDKYEKLSEAELKNLAFNS
jgi:hypothetical protein